MLKTSCALLWNRPSAGHELRFGRFAQDRLAVLRRMVHRAPIGGAVLLRAALLLAALGSAIGDASSRDEIDLATRPAPNMDWEVQSRWSQLPAPFDAGTFYSRELFVAPPGLDLKNENQGARGEMFPSILLALKAATPGTRITLLPGVHPGAGTISDLKGTAERPIALVGAGLAIVDGNGEAVGLHLSAPRFVVIQGIAFRNTWPHGINIDDGGTGNSTAHHIILRDLRFQDIGKGGNNDCLKLSGVDDFLVVGSEFLRCDRGEAIDMVGCHHGIVSRNSYRGIPGSAVQAKGGSSDILIHGNRFAEVQQRAINAGGHTGRDYFRPLGSQYEAARIQIVANVFEQVGDAPVAFVGCFGCVFANNTLVYPRRFVARILEENRERGPGSNGYFINNIVVLRSPFASLRRLVDVGDHSFPESFQFRNNLWVSSRPGLKPKLPGRERGALGDFVLQDPGFQDMASGNYRLTGDSPAIGRGVPVPGGLPADFLGRAYANPPSIGAFSGP